LNKLNSKTEEIKKYLSEIKDIAPHKFEEYKSNIEKKAACERYFEKIIEAVTDLAFLVIKTKKFEIPEDDLDAFNILLENKTISKTIADKLKDAKKMRNFIAHQYGKIDDKLVFDSITKELNKDVNDFIKEVKKCL